METAVDNIRLPYCYLSYVYLPINGDFFSTLPDTKRNGGPEVGLIPTFTGGSPLGVCRIGNVFPNP